MSLNGVEYSMRLLQDSKEFGSSKFRITQIRECQNRDLEDFKNEGEPSHDDKCVNLETSKPANGSNIMMIAAAYIS